MDNLDHRDIQRINLQKKKNPKLNSFNQLPLFKISNIDVLTPSRVNKEMDVDSTSPSPNNNVSLSFHKKRRKEKKKKAVIHGSSPFFSTDRVTDRGWRTMGGGQWASFKSDIMSSKTGRRQTATGRNRAEYCKYSGWALFPVYREATMGDKLHACSVGNTSLGRRTDPLLLSMHHGRIYP